MPRYRPVLERDSATRETLPLDTIVTIIPRQSKRSGAKNNVHSQELADHELIDLAVWHGFTREQVRIDKRDMGISANTTTINDRPALRQWLRELLPAGSSKVVLFSQEDRAFRDEEEVELNTFIREVKRHRGWVICGHKVYRLWEEYDADMFRMECKYAAKYIVHQVRGRLIPAVARAAQRGLYDGRGINIGYIVDYDARSVTYKQFVPYTPHAELVLHEIFERFARMPYPSVPALVRVWNASDGMGAVIDPTTGEQRQVPTLYFPALPPEMDQRVWNRQSWGRRRAFPPYGIDDPLRRGWLLREQGARRILSNVFYLGWVARGGIIVRGERLGNGQVRVDPKGPPLVLHEPIVHDQELFWYCFERVSPYTIEGQPNPKRQFYTQGPRQAHNESAKLRFSTAHLTRIRNAETNTLLLLGKVHCGVHGYRLTRLRLHPDEPDRYLCKYYDSVLGHRQQYCMSLRGREVDEAVVREFLDHLELASEDVEGIARAWQIQRLCREETARPMFGARIQEIGGELASLTTAIARTNVDAVRDRLVSEMEKLTLELGHLRKEAWGHEVAHAEAEAEPLSPAALRVAKDAVEVVKTLREKWYLASLASRQALVQWIVESVTLAPAPDDRKRLDGAIVWRGGASSQVQVWRTYGRRLVWDVRELDVLRRWYPTARWEDLHALLPQRTRDAMVVEAMRLGLPKRARHSVYWQSIPTDELVSLAPNIEHTGSLSMASKLGAQASAGTVLEADLLLGIVQRLDSSG